MAIIKMKFDEDFYKEEVREGYLVSAEMKKVWAVCLDLLNEFITVCEEYDLKYSVMYGTLLGAIRHKGFIPWDDDIDIVMDRNNYDKLCMIAPKAFSYPYFFQNDFTDFGFTRDFSRLRNSSTTAIQTYEMHANVPYNQGVWIDIFPMDNFPSDEKDCKEFRNRIRFLHGKMWNKSYKDIRFSPKEEKNFIDKLYNIYHLKKKNYFLAHRKQNTYRVRIEKETRKYNIESTGYIGVAYAFRETYKEQIFKQSDFEELISVPFEMISVSAPKNYKDILHNVYGDWEQPKMGNNIHGDVIFDTEVSYKDYISLQNN